MPTSHYFNLVALGDSISVAFNADKPGNNYAHSWSTGDQMLAGAGVKGASHFHRLQNVFPNLTIKTTNFAVNGARAMDLRSQVDQALRSQPDYVTLLIGANDVARWLTGEYGVLLDNYIEDVRSALKRLIEANPRIMILVVSIPDQGRILQLLTTDALGGGSIGAAVAALKEGAFAKKLMQSLRERWERVNRGLEELVRHFPQNVRFASTIRSARFGGEHISAIDSYHPSIAGQKLLAELAWNEGFFP